MTAREKAAFDAVCNLAKTYRAELAELRGETGFDADSVKRILQLPDSRLVDTAVAMGNLTAKEAEAVRLCCRLGYTQEEAAEAMDRSRNAVYNWLRTGLEKLETAWSSVWWLRRLSKN